MEKTLQRDILQNNRSELIKSINICDRLFQAMRNNKLLTKKQENKIRNSGDRTKQTETLLDVIPRLGRDGFGKFCKALATAGQEDVVHTFLQYTEIEEDEVDSCQDIFTRELQHIPNSQPRPPEQNSATGPSNKQPNLSAMKMKRNLDSQEQNIDQLIPKVISNVKNHWSELWELYKKLNRKQNISLVGINDGMTILHQIILHNRQSFLHVVSDLGIWQCLINVKVEGGPPEYRELTAMQMAHKMNHIHLVKEIDKINQQEEDLNEWHTAARFGDEEKIDQLLSHNPSPYVINEPSSGGKTPLYWATTSGNYKIMDKLVRAGADIFCRTDEGDSIMTRAVSLNHAHLVRPLVCEWGLDAEQHGLNRKSPIYIAAENGHMETFKALLSVGVPVSGLALTSAAVSGRTEFTLYLIDEYKLHPNWMDIMGKTALLAAAAADQETSIRILLEKGADVTAADKRKRNILHFAVEGGSEASLIKVLEVCKENDTLKSLLDAQDVFSGAESVFLVRGNDQGRPAWHYVLVKRSVMSSFRVRTQGGPIDVANYGTVVRSGWGQTPSQAVSNEIERKFSPDQILPSAPPDLTPLMLAIMKDKPNLVNILLEEKPRLDVQDSNGLTSLHLACMMGNVNIVKTLTLAGSSTEVCDNEGQTPLTIAKKNGHCHVANLLEGRKAVKLIKKFVHGDLARTHRALDTRSLEQVQTNQADMKRYAVEILRELQADIDQLLFDLGTAPVGQVTAEDE